MANGSKKKESAWKVFALLGAIAAVLAYGFLFVPDVRGLVGLSNKPVFSFSSLFKAGQGDVKTQGRALATIPKGDLETFCDSFTKREVEIIVIPPDVEVVKKPGVSDEVRKNMLESLWEVRVSGTFPDLEKNWQAIIQGQYCKAGRRLESRVEGRCAYQILEVGKKCVWMVAYTKGDKVPEMPEVEWPDVSFIVNDRIDGKLRPARVRFARGIEVGIHRVFKVSRTSDVSFRVVKLFDNGVCFEAFSGEASWFFGCMVVAP